MFLFLLFIFPLGVYCAILGFLNRRERPLMVSGPWDFAGVLFAASGFLLFVGPAVLSALHEKWRYYWLLGDNVSGEQMNDVAHYTWLAAWYLYYVAVVGASAFMLRRRRSQTAIYNVGLAELEVALARVLERLGVGWTRQGNHYFLKSGASSAAVLEVETFPAFCHATLRWQEVQRPLRQQIERDLEVVLAGMPTNSNPAGGWFLSLASLLLFATLLGVLFLVLVNLRLIR